MLVGQFGSYKDLPYLQLNKVGLFDEASVLDPIPFSLNTDNPGSFKTTIANEFRLMGRALKQSGYRSREIHRWLDEARKVGLASTFIPPWSPPTRAELLRAIYAIGHEDP